MPNIGDIIKSKSREVAPNINEFSLMKQIIKERVHPLDMLRELISNAGLKEEEGSTPLSDLGDVECVKWSNREQLISELVQCLQRC